LKVTTAKYYIPSGRCIQALDYSKRNEDGSVGSIPDSLISEYRTRNGRTVYDGGGIEPDFVLDPETLSQISIALLTRNIIFDFATVYATQYDSISPVGSFTLSSQDYSNFKRMVTSRDFSYETRSEKSLKKLMETAKREKYFDMAEEEFMSLESKLAHNNEKDLMNFEEEIRQLLKEEIVVRYYFQKGRVRVSIEDSPEIKKALEVLAQPELYLSTLNESRELIHARKNDLSCE
jgi:carboxyl-terminal processing protease